jgi:TP901-1 family phage major tail protein
MSGTDVLLLVNTGTVGSPVYTAVGSQRGLSREETTEEIDISSKDERAMRVLAGRYGSTMSLDALYVPDDASFLALKSAMRNGDLILVRLSEDGVEVEEADALVTSMSEEYPDVDAATISVALRIDGEWVTVGS